MTWSERQEIKHYVFLNVIKFLWGLPHSAVPSMDYAKQLYPSGIRLAWLHVDLACYTFPPTQHHSLFTNLPPLFICLWKIRLTARISVCRFMIKFTNVPLLLYTAVITWQQNSMFWTSLSIVFICHQPLIFLVICTLRTLHNSETFGTSDALLRMCLSSKKIGKYHGILFKTLINFRTFDCFSCFL